MYGLAHLTGAHQTGSLDEPDEFPRFLCRDEAAPMGLTPPPLPHVAWYVRVQWIMRRAAPHRMATIAASLVVLVPAATALVIDPEPPKLKVIQVTSIDQPQSNASDDLDTLAGLEARLEYGTNLAHMIDPARIAPTTETHVNDRIADAASPTAVPADLPDAPALLILSNLPENATFTAGVSAGNGQWVMAAGDPNQLEMTLGEGFDQPVSADVETISHAGLSLGLLHLELRRSVAAVAEAQAVPQSAAPQSQEPASLTEAEQVEPNDKANEADVKPRKRQHIPIKKKVARSDDGDAKRTNTAARWRAKTVVGTDNEGNNISSNGATDQPDATTGQNPSGEGTFSKFFTWLKSGGPQTAPAEGLVDETKATLFPYQGPR